MKLALKSIPLAAVVLSFAVHTNTVAGVTVGDFVRSTAELVGVTPATVEGMRAAGFAIPVTDPDASLTEADVVSVGAAIGVTMQTATPRAAVNERRALRILAYLNNHAPQTPHAPERKSEDSDPRHRPRSRSPRVPHNPHFPHGPR